MLPLQTLQMLTSLMLSASPALPALSLFSTALPYLASSSNSCTLLHWSLQTNLCLPGKHQGRLSVKHTAV
jgi:hypothetical protein